MWEPCLCEPCRRKQKLDAYLAEVYKQFISIADSDLKRGQEVFRNVFDQVTRKMKEKSNYYRKYCNEVLYAGSVFDDTKVGHMDEFDMDIVISLPICYDEINVENDQPGFLLLQIADAFDNLDKQPDWESCHKILRDWRDSDKYLLQNKIRHWLQGVVTRALDELRGRVVVNGTVYIVTYKESGPAYTLQIRNKGGEQFQLDVDLVPVIRFQQPRWPEGYKVRQGVKLHDWFVVPKPNKVIQNNALNKNRSWRLSFQNHEREMMKGSYVLKTTLRLVKKLRDGLELKSIASYYIKTLFLWEIECKDKSFWCNKLSLTFREMVTKLYNAVKDRKIMYFWHPDHNLLKGVSDTLLQNYEYKLQEVLGAIYSDDCEKVVSALLTTDELMRFKTSDFYKEFSIIKSTNFSNQSLVQISLQPPPPFQFEHNSDNVASSWEKWKRSFKIFYEASELSKKERKVQVYILLHIIGDQCREECDQFSKEFETVDDLLLKFDEVFVTKENLTLVRQTFFTRNQKDSESIDQYVAELKKIAIKCEFKELCDDLVRDRMLCGIKERKLKEKLLGETDLTSKAIVTYRLSETSQSQVICAEHPARESVDKQESKVNPTADLGTTSRTNTYKGTLVIRCSRCGGSHRRRQCPAYGQRCFECARMNHFADVCWFAKS